MDALTNATHGNLHHTLGGIPWELGRSDFHQRHPYYLHLGDHTVIFQASDLNTAQFRDNVRMLARRYAT